MQNNRLLYALFEILLLMFLYIMAASIFNEEYLFEWIANNWLFYIFLVVIPLFFLFSNKKIMSIIITIGIIVSSFAANYLGELIQENNIDSITSSMSAEQVASLHDNPAFIIFIIFMIIFIGLAFIFNFLFKKKKMSIKWL